MFGKFIGTLMLLVFVLPTAAAEPSAPWGHSAAQEQEYKPNKAVYDIAVSTVPAFTSVLDRASYLSQVYHADPFDASIILVLHGPEINYFAISNYAEHKDLMQRAQSLTVGGIIKIRMCRLAAKAQGYEPKDIHGFVEMVPMADAEIVRLQRDEGYAYMR